MHKRAGPSRRACYTFHMRKLVIPLIVAPLFFAFASLAYAQSSASLQAELNALLAQLAALQAQLQVTTGTPTATPAPVPSGSYGQCPSLYRSMRPGISGPDVAALQAFLAADSRLYPEGTVSGYYGALTQKAVQALQQRHNLVTSGTPDTTGFGAVGPATRNLIASLCQSGATPSTPVVPGGGCTLNGVIVANGKTADFFSVTVAPTGSSCEESKQTRQCINGSLSGSPAFQHPTCGDSKCTIDGISIANGVSGTFHSRRRVDGGESCSSYAQVRTCVNGTMSGSSNFTYSSCYEDTPDSCTLNGVTVAHGQSRTFYKVAAGASATCSSNSQSRTCNDGDLSGSDDYSKTSCSVGACEIDGVIYPNGSSTTLYFAQNIPANEQCSSYAQTRTCSSGVFGGNAAYKYRSCSTASSGSCVLDSVVLTNGQSSTFYSTSTAAVGTTCAAASQTRTCTSGTLSGTASYNRASCSDTKTCVLDGVSVPHNESRTFYNARTTDFGTTCSSKAQTRTCSNGAFSGSDTFAYANCSVNPPVSVAGTAQLAAALTALESILRSALDALNTWF
jgi:hypothetical protein